MKIRLLLFGPLAELVAPELQAFELPEGARAADVIDALGRSHPAARERLRSVALAVNQAFVLGGRLLCDGDEVAVIPPVSGD